MKLRSIAVWIGVPLLSLGVARIASRLRAVELVYGAFVGSPKLQVPSEVSFGQRIEGESVVVETPLVNWGRSPLTIDKFKTNCGCSGVQQKAGEGYRPISNLTLQPGETQSVFLKFTIPVQSPPTIRHTVGFTTNDPVSREAFVQVVGNVVGKLISVPNRIILGAIPKNQSIDLKIELRDTGTDEDVSQLKALCSLPGFDFSIEQGLGGADQPTLGRLIGLLRISIKTPDQLPMGHFDTTVDIVSLKDPNHRFLSIPINGDILPWFVRYALLRFFCRDEWETNFFTRAITASFAIRGNQRRTASFPAQTPSTWRSRTDLMRKSRTGKFVKTRQNH